MNFTTGAFTVVSEIFRKLFCGAPETSCLSKFKDYIVTGRNKNWGSYCLCLVTEAQEGPLCIFLTVVIIIITWMFIKKWNSLNSSRREKCPNTELFLVRIQKRSASVSKQPLILKIFATFLRKHYIGKSKA